MPAVANNPGGTLTVRCVESVEFPTTEAETVPLGPPTKKKLWLARLPKPKAGSVATSVRFAASSTVMELLPIDAMFEGLIGMVVLPVRVSPTSDNVALKAVPPQSGWWNTPGGMVAVPLVALAAALKLTFTVALLGDVNVRAVDTLALKG